MEDVLDETVSSEDLQVREFTQQSIFFRWCESLFLS